jgi:D-sedoheptulose 7-phosphate isomerase
MCSRAEKGGETEMLEGAMIRDGLTDLANLAREVEATLVAEVKDVARETWESLAAGGKLFFCGNGGSAAEAQHLAAEYVVRFSANRRALPALALTTDTSVLTAGANDFGFEEVFARQIGALGSPGDLLFLYSTSGNSANLLRAAQAAAESDIRSVAFLAGDGGLLREMVDRAIIVPTRSTARAQEIHLALGHLICQIVETRVAGGKE